MAFIDGVNNNKNVTGIPASGGQVKNKEQSSETKSIPMVKDDQAKTKLIGWEIETNPVQEECIEDQIDELKKENEELRQALKDCEKNSEGVNEPDNGAMPPVQKEQPTEKSEPPKTGQPPKTAPKKPIQKVPPKTEVVPPAETEKPEENVPSDKNSGGPKVLTDKEVRDASSDGKRVAKMLIGPTKTNDQSTIKEVIYDRVNADNVVEFLRGYEEEHGIRGDNFFEQLFTEDGFDDQYELMTNVAKKIG